MNSSQRAFSCNPRRIFGADCTEDRQGSMTFLEQAKAILTDSHFLIPLIVFFIGLGLLITLH
jgi:hypothetical protein